MKQELINHLKGAFLFQGLPDETLATVAEKVSLRQLAEGDTLIQEGETGDALYVIHDGWFKIVTHDAQGGEVIINKVGPGETIGEMALLDSAPRSASAIALSTASVLELKKDAFLAILDGRPDVALALIRRLSSRLRFSTTYIQQAIHWSQRIGEGDYSFIEQAPPVENEVGSDEDKAAQFLSAFFKMVRSVKAREDDLKQQLERLTLEIDEARRKTEFEDLTGTDFYAKLKDQARRLREQRKASQGEDSEMEAG
jgi:CRP-like cAMP-binding protein